VKKVLIIGGGFAGVYAAKRLLKENVRVTLVSKTNYFLFIPMLHEVASGNLCGHNLAEPFKDILRGKNFEFVQDTAEFIDLKNKKVIAGPMANEGKSLVYNDTGTFDELKLPGEKGNE